jgi:hypothetical protein
MKTTDLFKSNRSPKRLNESLEKTFGTKINFEDFDTTKLEDARNKLRTQIHDARSQSGFNETIENETLTKAQWMHDAIVAELMDREEHIVDTSIQEGGTFDNQEVIAVLKAFDENMNERGGYGDPNYEKILDALHDYDVESAIDEVWNAYSDQDGGEIDMDDAIEDLEGEFKFLVHSDPSQRVRPAEGVAEGPRDRRDAYQRDYDNSVAGMDGKGYAHSQDGGGNDERHDLDPPVDPRETMMYNLTVDGEPLNPKPIRGRSNLIKFGKEQKDAGVDLTNAMISPVKESVAEKFDPLKHVKNPTQGEKDAARDVKRGSYGDRAAMLKSAEADGRLKDKA